MKDIKEEETIKERITAIMYVDSKDVDSMSCSGVHIIVCTNIPTKLKPITPNSLDVISEGYVTSNVKNEVLYPIDYIDIAGCTKLDKKHTTVSDRKAVHNDRHYLLGLINGLEELINIENLTHITFNISSKQKKSSVKKLITPCSNDDENYDLWTKINNNIDKLKSKGSVPSINFYTDVSNDPSEINLGLSITNMLTNIGMNLGIQEINKDNPTIIKRVITPAKNYIRKSGNTINPLLNTKMITISDSLNKKPNRYYVSSPVKELKLALVIGNTLYGIVDTDMNVGNIELIKNSTSLKPLKNYVASGLLSNINHNHINRYINIFGDSIFNVHQNLNNNLFKMFYGNENNTILTQMQDAISNINTLTLYRELEHTYDLYSNEPEKFLLKKDITDLFYVEIDGKTKLKQGIEHLKYIPVKLDRGDYKGVINKDYLDMILTIPLVLGSDILPKNNLSKLAGHNPVIELLIKENKKKYDKYYIIIKSDIGKGIYCDVFSNNLIF